MGNIDITMFLAPFLIGFLIVGTGDARSLTDSLAEKNLQLVFNGDQLEVRKTLPQNHVPEEKVGALATSIAMSLLMGLIRDMIRDTIFGILGITTTTTTTAAPCGGLLGFGLLAAPCTTTTSEATTTIDSATTTVESATTTTDSTTTTTTESPTTTTTTTLVPTTTTVAETTT